VQEVTDLDEVRVLVFVNVLFLTFVGITDTFRVLLDGERRRRIWFDWHWHWCFPVK
jgi:hypothetical protein